MLLRLAKDATDCEESDKMPHERFEITPGIYFCFNVHQGLQDYRDRWQRYGV